MSFLNKRLARPDDAGKPDPLAEFRCDQAREVLALLREMRDAVTPLALSAPDGAGLGATIWTVDADRQRLAFDVESDDPKLASLVDADEVTAVAYMDSVKLQFDLQDLVLVRSAHATALQARLPHCIYRFQRRASFRVSTLDRGAPNAGLRHPALPEMALSLRIIDLSVGGCALILPADVPALSPGITLHGVVLELDPVTRLPVTLRLQHASSILSRPSALRLGCELVAPDPAVTRSLQRYIDLTQKRRRLLSLD